MNRREFLYLLGLFFSGFIPGCDNWSPTGPDNGEKKKEIEEISTYLEVMPWAIYVGQEIYHFRGDYIQIMNDKGKNLDELAVLPGEGVASHLNVSGDYLVYQFKHDNRSSIIYRNFHGGGAQPIEFGLSGSYGKPSISPDKQWMMLTKNSYMGLVDFPVTSNPISLGIKVNSSKGGYSWKPVDYNGKRTVAASIQTRDGINIYEIEFDLPDRMEADFFTNNPPTINEVTKGAYNDYNPCYSLDGNHIAFDTTRERVGGSSNNTICVVDKVNGVWSEPYKVADFGETPKFGPANEIIFSRKNQTERWSIMMIRNVFK